MVVYHGQVNEADFELLEAEMAAQREALHEAFAEDLSDEPEDNDVPKCLTDRA